MTNLIKHEWLTTTVTWAKEMRWHVERMVWYAKPADNTAHKRVWAYVYETKATWKLIKKIAPRYKEQPAGFTWITRLNSYRKNDKGDKAQIEFIGNKKERYEQENLWT
mgnify:CR=1 FL=1